MPPLGNILDLPSAYEIVVRFLSSANNFQLLTRQQSESILRG